MKNILTALAITALTSTLAYAQTASTAGTTTKTTDSQGMSTSGGIGHFNCTGGDSYDVQKGMCIPTTGAAAYSPHMVVDQEWAKTHEKQLIQ